MVFRCSLLAFSSLRSSRKKRLGCPARDSREQASPRVRIWRAGIGDALEGFGELFSRPGQHLMP